MNFVKTAALLLAGGAFFGGWGRVRPNVKIEGLDVGGMTYAEAENAIRVHIYESLSPLTIHAPTGDLVISDLTLNDNAAYLVRRAKKGESFSLTYSRNWANMEGVLYDLCRKNAQEAVDAELRFSAEGFTYFPETRGIACDYHAAIHDVTEALKEGKSEVTLNCRPYAPEITEEVLRERTQRLSVYSTWFDKENEPRRHNIALACARIAGTVLEPNAEFSFNETVGRRTAENGFLVANVITGGEFVPGVGGGVCQASTTLFQAALHAGMTVTESRAHSLSVGYVPPSLDAMVSEASDLKFVNPYAFPVYILSSVKGGTVSFSFFGMPDGRRYETESVVLTREPPPAPELVEGEEDRVLRAEKEGITSESYLLVYDSDGTLLSRTRIRKDKYAVVQGKLEFKKSAEEDGV